MQKQLTLFELGEKQRPPDSSKVKWKHGASMGTKRMGGDKRQFTRYSLVAEIAIELRKSPLAVEERLDGQLDGILETVNKDSDKLNDEILPRLATELSDLEDILKGEETWQE